MMAKFGERLRHLRTLHDLSQMDLAKQLKTSKSSINMYERCEREPNLVMLEAIADFFNVDLDYLLGKSDFPRKHISEISPTLTLSQPQHSDVNLLKLAGRDGTYFEKVLTDQQMEEIMKAISAMPDASDNL